ncbi:MULTISPECIES: 50S ribosomal protein L30 [Virgibacillus]|jgi:large subunit ribosomal protein L30|uniref:Large ribosomal subunit protein uL30 n=1 Tax=Virgibacillus halodenitrificans TaxID=1482 RepID=A0AAC9IZL4_VIRHA|nr:MULTISPECIES: 50S ribosomal protein L30 [Virgibacillus]AIF42066.1 50S ribosomal protein L30 [Virgibacillus sp. SK37]APC46829.1 50S ribosomal protein L30 [Virgibacillus halodenitrificans]MBD1224007.1 50S ribosomal protein L30 [Virgibacillus halodenitrificans]MCG1029569.1 50S ribosomal protein L30 [Virgibacillus halodenitrificans]MCJ0933074.1 50S ribosomal protein L30 [Virgibacillus halodenitrificans]
MSKKLEITLTRSVIGGTDIQRKTVQALGLKKIRQSVVREDTAAVRGMVNKVSHLISVKEV